MSHARATTLALWAPPEVSSLAWALARLRDPAAPELLAIVAEHWSTCSAETFGPQVPKAILPARIATHV